MPQDDLSYLLDVAREAGRLALGHFGQVRGEHKGDGTLFSRADTATEELIRERLGARWPDDAIVGEELSGPKDVCDGRAWIIDPVDGTLNYLFGLQLWCVSIGLTVNGRPTMGVIYAPATDEMWFATQGCGAFLNGQPIRTFEAEKLNTNQLIGCDSIVMDRAQVRVAPRKRNIGSAALHACYVAQGTFCASVYAEWGLWDLAAGLCIAAEAGAPAWRLDGSPLDGLGGFCATTKAKELVVISPPQVKDAIIGRIKER